MSNSFFPRNLYHNLPRMVLHDTFKSLSDFQWDFMSQLQYIIIVGMMSFSLSHIQLTTVI